MAHHVKHIVQGHMVNTQKTFIIIFPWLKKNYEIYYDFVENESMPPWNMPLWHKDHFGLKATEKKQMQEKLSALPSLPG